ncbi:MAG: RDD family protein [Clostridia bacterium]|nr:RDD family protein [Clostridia bacterium]
MICDLQKASVWKRISARLFDIILFGILAVGLAFLLSTLLNYDGYSARLEDFTKQYEEAYGVVFDISMEEYNALSDAQKQVYDEALAAFSADEEVSYVYTMLFNLTLLITTFALLLAYLILELTLPLILGNGQTLGKKIFGIGLVRVDCVKITALQLFVRTVLGKFTVETMIPVLLVIMLLFGILGMEGIAVILALLLLQAGLLLIHRHHAVLHDLLAGTVAVELASQMVFESPEARVEYQKRIHAEQAATSDR